MKNKLTFAVAGVLLWSRDGAAADLRLKYAVIVTRHGVRAPTWDAARLNQYSAQPWPDWGVPPGYLTPHGRAAMERMGAYYRDWLQAEHLLAAQGCAAAARVTIYADKDQRTVETGRALAQALLPGCGLKTFAQPGDAPDPLFSGTFVADPKRAAEAVLERAGPRLLDRHRAAFETLQAILGDAPKKILEPAADVVKGPFATGSTLSEDLLLEYTNGNPNPGWGRLTAENLQQALEIHGVYADLMRRTPYLARRGANLLAAIEHSLEQAATGKPAPGALGKPGDALLILSGHDTNLCNLSGLLGLSWTLPGYQPDETPPGGALIFSLWQDEQGSLLVRAWFLAQTPGQIRNLDSTPPARQELTIRGCQPCTWARFKQSVEAAAEP